MKIDEIRLYGFDLPFIKPVAQTGQSIDSRKGFIIQVLSSDGCSGFGEVSPFEGVHVESLKKARHDYDLCCPLLKGREVPDDAVSLLAWCAQFEPFMHCCPSARFGLEVSLLSLAASRQKISLAVFLGSEDVQGVQCAGFLQGSVTEIIEAALKLKVNGFKTVELKVGGRNIPLEVLKVAELKRVLGPGINIRLNANAAWTLKEALLFARGIGNDQIEFIKEPLTDAIEWFSFFRQTDIPLAADEHLSDFIEPDLAQASGVKYTLIRPSCLGNIGKIIHFLVAAHEHGQKVIITSCFESGVGLNILANFAALTGITAGIGASFSAEHDLLKTSLITGECSV